MQLIPMDEIKRKIFHLFTLIYIVIYWFTTARFVLIALGIVIFVVIAVEIIRMRNAKFNQWLFDTLGNAFRGHEKHQVSGLAFTLSGSFFTILLFFGNKNIVMASFMYMAFGDTFAALIGRAFGKHKITKDKTLEGSIACFFVCLFCGLFFLNWPLAIFGAFIATVIELVPWPLNDNFWMPLVSSGALIFAITNFRMFSF